MMRAERKKQDDRNRNPDQPEQYGTHELDPKTLFGEENRRAHYGSADVMTSIDERKLKQSQLDLILPPAAP